MNSFNNVMSAHLAISWRRKLVKKLKGSRGTGKKVTVASIEPRHFCKKTTHQQLGQVHQGLQGVKNLEIFALNGEWGYKRLET